MCFSRVWKEAPQKWNLHRPLVAVFSRSHNLWPPQWKEHEPNFRSQSAPSTVQVSARFVWVNCHDGVYRLILMVPVESGPGSSFWNRSFSTNTCVVLRSGQILSCVWLLWSLTFLKLEILKRAAAQKVFLLCYNFSRRIDHQWLSYHHSNGTRSTNIRWCGPHSLHLQRPQSNKTWENLINVWLTYILCQSQAVRIGDRWELLLLQLLNSVLLVPQIQLGAHQDDGRGGAVVTNLRVPLARRRRETRSKRKIGKNGKLDEGVFMNCREIRRKI